MHATVDVLDLPGFNFVEEHGRAAARRLIGQVRAVDMLVLVIRAFEDPSVPPYRQTLDPKRDLGRPLKVKDGTLDYARACLSTPAERVPAYA